MTTAVKGTAELSGTEDLLVHVEDRIATVTINRAAKHNAMNLTVFAAIGRVFTALDADPELRCVVVRGAGGKAFSAGADISEFESVRKDKAAAKKYAELSGPSNDAVVKCRHPVIALIEGLCVGGGFGLAALCDLRICGESSRFGVPVKRLGLVESMEELEFQVKKYGANAMLQVLLVGDLLPAAEALRYGIVNKVVPDDQVEAAAYEWAAKIAEGAPLTARWHKQFIYRLMEPAPLTEAEKDMGYDAFDTEDFQRGYKAFLAKAKPSFVGR
ncbi:MAG TPA: enoyl-CoA hydratase-related protein [Thalassobaculum sp.]